MADIFVSYSRDDKHRVEPLVRALEEQGWSVWWDPKITPGDDFEKLIARELKDAKSVIVVWSGKSVDSRWVKGEARDAADRGILASVRFDGVTLPIDFRAIHTTDFDDWKENAAHEAFCSLCDSLAAKLAKHAEANKPSASETDNRPTISICVLPFSNMSGDPEQDYFSDGVTEDIITDLSKIAALSVVSRNTAFSFKGKAVDLRQVAKQTMVSHVLEGSVRKSGNRVRITAQLIDASNDAHLWAERYDRDLDDIFALQDEISEAVVAALKLQLLPEEKKALEKRSTQNPEAYKLYLMARQFWLLDNERNNEVVIRICKHVVGLDPNYAEAWATMALAQWNLFAQTSMHLEDHEYAAQQALALGPNFPDSHAAVAAALRSKGDFSGALKACAIALKLDPLSYIANRMAGLCCMGLRNFDDAIQYFDVAAEAMESDFTAAHFVTQCYQTKGDVSRIRSSAKRAMARIEKVVAAEPGHSRAIGLGVYQLCALGDRERAIEWATRARLIDPDNANLQYNLACSMSVLGEYDRALEILKGVTEKASPGMVTWIEKDSDFDRVRDDPRYIEMISAAKTRLG